VAKKQSKYTDISVDIESLSVRGTAAILSIGATMFNRNTGEMGNPFYRVVDIASVLNRPEFHVQDSTLRWWLGQGAAADDLFGSGHTGTIEEIARAFNTYSVSEGDLEIWAGPSHFDLAAITHAIAVAGEEPHFKHWLARDLNTLCALADFDKRILKFQGIKHRADHDAIHQAKIACTAMWICGAPGVAKASPQHASAFWAEKDGANAAVAAAVDEDDEL